MDLASTVMFSAASRCLLLAALLVQPAACGPRAAGEECVEGECEKGLICASDGRCAECNITPECKRDGLCVNYIGRCIATEESCGASETCKKDGRCTQLGGTCVTWQTRQIYERPPQPDNPDAKEGGCPCGCDRSEELLGELAVAGPEAGLAVARASLATIAERERAGYVTDAMIEHRLRLRAFERTHADAPGPDERAFREGPSATAARRATLASFDLGDLTVTPELLVFGRTVEHVRGREKELPPAFRLWLSIENRSHARRVVERPALRSDVPLDTRRWYLEGADGEPWDGALAAGERRDVLLIGWIDAPLDPGSQLAAELSVEGARLPLATTALGAWDARADD